MAEAGFQAAAAAHDAGSNGVGQAPVRISLPPSGEAGSIYCKLYNVYTAYSVQTVHSGVHTLCTVPDTLPGSRRPGLYSELYTEVKRKSGFRLLLADAARSAHSLQKPAAASGGGQRGRPGGEGRWRRLVSEWAASLWSVSRRASE